MTRILLALAVLGLAAGCAIAPRYTGYTLGGDPVGTYGSEAACWRAGADRCIIVGAGGEVRVPTDGYFSVAPITLPR